MEQQQATPEEFVRAWQGSSALWQAADRLDLTEDVVLARAAEYRKTGVPLKRLSRRLRLRFEVTVIEKGDPESDGYRRNGSYTSCGQE